MHPKVTCLKLLLWGVLTEEQLDSLCYTLKVSFLHRIDFFRSNLKAEGRVVISTSRHSDLPEPVRDALISAGLGYSCICTDGEISGYVNIYDPRGPTHHRYLIHDDDIVVPVRRFDDFDHCDAAREAQQLFDLPPPFIVVETAHEYIEALANEPAFKGFGSPLASV